MDVVRNRMQAQPPNSTKYSGMLHCFRTCVAEEGVGVLYRGLGITLLRAAPVAMTVLPTFDLVRGAIKTHLHV
jgi:solute carrier family 25 carnitine/acylcarnitine transporter 20/29